MILRMASWLKVHGYDTDPNNAEGVLWGIDRHYPGGFSRFAADYLAERRPRARA